MMIFRWRICRIGRSFLLASGFFLVSAVPETWAQQPQQTQNPFGDNPLGKVLQDMFGGGAPQDQPQQSPGPQQREAPQPQTNPSGRPRNPFDDIFGKMFEAGAQQRDDYQKGMESIFDQFKRGMDRR